MTPPPQYVSRVCSVICALMPVLTLYLGQIDVSVTSAGFVVAMALLMQRQIPRFAQFTSSMFGLFYCGYLPCFWVKLRCGLAVPALNTRLGASYPVILGGPTQWTIGLVATLISIGSIIAADTFAFIEASAVAFGFLNFFGSLFGELTKSIIKRDAGVKDSGSLISGHGGILDIADSYIFTGALAYSFVKMVLLLYGV